MKTFESPTVDAEADFFLYAEPPPVEYLLKYHEERKRAGKTGKEASLIIMCTNAAEVAALLLEVFSI